MKDRQTKNFLDKFEKWNRDYNTAENIQIEFQRISTELDKQISEYFDSYTSTEKRDKNIRNLLEELSLCSFKKSSLSEILIQDTFKSKILEQISIVGRLVFDAISQRMFKQPSCVGVITSAMYPRVESNMLPSPPAPILSGENFYQSLNTFQPSAPPPVFQATGPGLFVSAADQRALLRAEREEFLKRKKEALEHKRLEGEVKVLREQEKNDFVEKNSQLDVDAQVVDRSANADLAETSVQHQKAMNAVKSSQVGANRVVQKREVVIGNDAREASAEADTLANELSDALRSGL